MKYIYKMAKKLTTYDKMIIFLKFNFFTKKIAGLVDYNPCFLSLGVRKHGF
jgi:hypothetical protein